MSIQYAPVVGEAVEAVVDERRPDLALDRDLHVGRDEVEHRALEDVRAGGDEVRRDRLVGRGLLEELLDGVVVAQADEAVARRVRDRDERERADGAGRLVLGDLRAEVEVGEDVAVEHEEALVEEVLGVLQRARGAARLGLLDEAQPDAELRPVAEHVAHAGGEEAARHDHVVDAVAAQPLEHVDDERPVDERHDRLGDGRRQGPQSRPLPAHEDHRLHCSASRCITRRMSASRGRCLRR